MALQYRRTGSVPGLSDPFLVGFVFVYRQVFIELIRYRHTGDDISPSTLENGGVEGRGEWFKRDLFSSPDYSLGQESFSRPISFEEVVLKTVLRPNLLYFGFTMVLKTSSGIFYLNNRIKETKASFASHAYFLEKDNGNQISICSTKLNYWEHQV